MVKYALYVKKTGKYYFNTKFNDYDEFKQKEETIEEMKLKIMYEKRKMMIWMTLLMILC
jgi:hypothetical protein